MKPDSPMSGSAGELPAEKAIQLSLAPSPHRNQQLFSDHYLNVILPKREDWQLLVSEADPFMRELQRILAEYTPSDKEAQLEDDLVKPALRLLKHVFEVQPSLETPDGTKAPDYVF